MKLFNIHTHTVYSHDGKAEPVALCKQAIAGGLSGFAVTDHCDCEYAADPLVFERVMNSFADSERIKEKYRDELIIASGVEIGEAIYDPVFAAKVIGENPWDVVLGSVHAVRVTDWDMPFSIIDFSDKDDTFIKNYLHVYFDDMREMIRTADFDVLCHLTVPLRYICGRYGRKVDIAEYLPQIKENLSLIIKDGKTLEINTSGCTDNNRIFMPDEMITELYISLGGKNFTVGSDAHTEERLCTGLYDAAQILKQKGINKLTYYIGRKPVEYII